MPDGTSIGWVSDRCLLVRWRDEAVAADCLHAAAARLWAARLDALRDVTPAWASVMLTFDAARLDPASAEDRVRGALDTEAGRGERSEQADRAFPPSEAGFLPCPPAHSPAFHASPQVVEIPVCYEGACAPDIEDVARMNNLTPTEVAALHSGAEYVVRFIGFSPGFAYLDGLPERLSTPRLDQPRTRVPAGSVGIAGSQTGVYPHATPGGWRLIGRTPLRLFDPMRDPPALLGTGDRVRFIAISWTRFQAMQEESAGAIQPSSRGPTPKAAGPAMRVEVPGLLTTVQDLGREGFGGMGVPIGGAADSMSYRLGNRLVGNEDGAPALEMTLLGGTFQFCRAACLVLAGGSLDARIEGADGESRPVAVWTPIDVRAGERLRIGAMASGCRAYLCIAGGVIVPRVLGSASTHVGAGFGGHEGRALRNGDSLWLGGALARERRALSSVERAALDESFSRRVIRAVEGAHARMFDPAAVDAFWRSEFVVSRQSDRMGLRLEGPVIASPGAGRWPSEPMPRGAVQVPEGGRPIVLMPDHPTTGGYPVIACAATVDLPALGQLRPGDRIRFERVSIVEALALLRQQEIGIR